MLSNINWRAKLHQFIGTSEKRIERDRQREIYAKYIYSKLHRILVLCEKLRKMAKGSGVEQLGKN